MAYTPRKYMLSSVFMTPPDSEKKPFIPTTPRPLPLLSIMMSPADTTKYTVKDTRDILTGLIGDGLPSLADSILSLLSPSDLIECMQVSRKWYDMVTSRKNLMDKISSYRIGRTNDENFPESFNHRPQLHPRHPLASIPLNIKLCRLKPPVSSGLPSTKCHHPHIPCPHCRSPAKVLNQRRVECSKCNRDFCTNCSYQWHEGVCPFASPKRPSQREAIAGTQLCRKRLRRL